jgi:hypothetical protein
MVGELNVIIQHWWNDDETGKPKYPELGWGKSQYHFVHQKPPVD